MTDDEEFRISRIELRLVFATLRSRKTRIQLAATGGCGKDSGTHLINCYGFQPEFPLKKLPWCEAGPPNHVDGKADSDQ